MHIFLQGPRGIGKSTVIRRALDILTSRAPVSLGGFITWNGGNDDPHIYMRAAAGTGEIYRLASYASERGGMIRYPGVFEQVGVRLLRESTGAELILMDELGFLESDATAFQKAVLDTLAGDIPVLGVLRLGDIPWHTDIKSDPRVTLREVNEKNRDTLPRELADALFS